MEKTICLTKQKSGLKRNSVDKFYTKPYIVELCFEKIKENINIDYISDLIIEPSAGNGAFINKIKENSNDYKFYDLFPELDEIEKKDYLTVEYQDFINPKIHIIGNPPFGRQSSLALKFIKFSSLFCDSISFILPKSFKKQSLHNKIPLEFHLTYQIDLPENSFLLNDEEYDVPCIFQIWIKKANKRIKSIKEKPKNFSFTKKNEPHDISFRRVGINAGDISKETKNKSIQTHYFIKFEKMPSEIVIEKLKNINFSVRDNTVGPKSISKPELIKEFNIIL